MSNRTRIDENKYENVRVNYCEKLLSLDESCKAINITVRTYYNICKRIGKKSVAGLNNNYDKQTYTKTSYNTQTSQTSEILNKFGSSEPETKYTDKPTPQRGYKISEASSELARKMRQEAIEKNLVSENHYDDIDIKTPTIKQNAGYSIKNDPDFYDLEARNKKNFQGIIYK